MDNNSRSFGERVRQTTSSGKQRLGHGIEDVRSRVGSRKVVRSERTGTAPAPDRDSTLTSNIPGNTSETGVGSPVAGSGERPRGTTLRSPLGRPAGCTAPTGAAFIATISLLGAIIKSRQR